MYTVKQASERMEISVHTLRFYANNDLFPFMERNANNIRQFSDKDLEWIKLVKCLRDTGMPIEEIKKYIELCKTGDSTFAERLEMILAQKEKALAQMNDLLKSIDLLKFKAKFYQECINGQNKDNCNPATGSLSLKKRKFKNTSAI